MFPDERMQYLLGNGMDFILFTIEEICFDINYSFER